MGGVYLSALAGNSAILTAMGSKQSINYTDPTKYDWLKFKAGDHTLDMTGGMLSMMHFLGTIAKEGFAAKKKVRGVDEDRSKTMAKTSFDYARGKLSPFASTAVDVLSKEDYSGRPLPLPWSDDQGTKFKPRYKWDEYLEDQQLPIFVSEGFKVVHDQMRDSGVPEVTRNQVLTGVLSSAISGITGARVGVDYSSDRKDNKTKTESKQKFHP